MNKKIQQRNKIRFAKFFSAFFIIVLFISFCFAQEEAKVKKAYSWLMKELGKTQGLDIKQISFGLLALKEKLSERQKENFVKLLYQKSYDNGTCWPGPAAEDCDGFTTAIAKLGLNSIGKTIPKVDQWLLSNTKLIQAIGIEWYLQLLGGKSTCLLTIEESVGMLTIDKDGYVSLTDVKGNVTNCLIPLKYWLNIKDECANKTIKIKCEQEVKVNFLFKKGNEWYLIDELKTIPAQQEIMIEPIKQLCVVKKDACDYEATLWAAYALRNRPEAKNFFVYLISETKNKNNEGYFPYAFLYALTNSSSFLEKAKAFRVGGTGNASVLFGISQTGQSQTADPYYYTGIAGLTSVLKAVNDTVIKESLLSLQDKEGFWQWQDQDAIIDTALVLAGVWPSTLSMCEEKGFSCVADCVGVGGAAVAFDCGGKGVCCDLSNAANSCELLNGNCTTNCSNNSVKVSLNCESGQCCKPLSEVTCAEINGSVCNAADKCVKSNVMISFLSVKDTSYCCNGTCTAAAKNCSELGGEKCNPAEGKSCPAGKQIVSSDGLCCQPGFCQAQLLSCKEMGGTKCSATQECVGGQLVIAADTGGQANCCIEGGKCIASSCSYKVCEIGEKCSGESYETAEGKCCKGECIEDVSCVEKNGTICPEDKVCEDGAFITASDTTRCCISVCKEKKAIWPTVLLVIILLGVAGAIIYLVISGKMKGLVGALKKKKPPKPPLMPMTKPLAMPQAKTTATTTAPPIKFKELPKPPK